MLHDLIPMGPATATSFLTEDIGLAFYQVSPLLGFLCLLSQEHGHMEHIHVPKMGRPLSRASQCCLPGWWDPSSGDTALPCSSELTQC